jgi:hypothetical protein
MNFTGTIPAPWLAKAMMKFDPATQGFIAGSVARTLSAQEKSGTIGAITSQSTMARTESTVRAPGTAFKRGSVEGEGITYECVSYGFENPVPDEDIQFYGSQAEALMSGGMVVRGKMLTDLERRVAAMIYNTSTFTGAALYTDVSGSNPWATAASNVISTVTAAKEKVRKSGSRANALIIGEATLQNLLLNDGVKARFPGATMISEEMLRANLAAIFGIKYLFVGGSVYNSANEGQTKVTADVWSSSYAMIAKVAETDNPTEACVARTVSWSAMGKGTDAMVSIYREPQTASTVIQSSMYTDEIIIDSSFGHLLKIA